MSNNKDTKTEVDTSPESNDISSASSDQESNAATSWYSNLFGRITKLVQYRMLPPIAGGLIVATFTFANSPNTPRRFLVSVIILLFVVLSGIVVETTRIIVTQYDEKDSGAKPIAYYASMFLYVVTVLVIAALMLGMLSAIFFKRPENIHDLIFQEPVLSQEEFDDRLGEYRNDELEIVAKLYKHHKSESEDYDKYFGTQIDFLRASMRGSGIHERTLNIVTEVEGLITKNVTPSSIQGLTEAAGPNGKNIDNWLQSIENHEIAVPESPIAGKRSLRWWLIYACTRKTLGDPKVKSWIKFFEMGKSLNNKTLYAQFGHRQERAETISSQLKSNLLDTIRPFDTLHKTNYSNWRDKIYDHKIAIKKYEETVRTAVIESCKAKW